MNLTTTANAASMTSVELLEIINAARIAAGEPEIRRNKFSEKIEDELEGEHYPKRVVQNLNGTESAVYDLNRDQCMLVSMRESKSVRRAVLAKLNELADKPQPIAMPSYAESLRLLADQIEETARVTVERDLAVATKALIGSKREATAMATASAAKREASRLAQELGRGVQHATIIAVEKASDHKFGSQGYRPLQKWCKANGVTPVKVPCPRYGKAISWPAQAWMAVYGVDLGELFGEEVAE